MFSCCPCWKNLNMCYNLQTICVLITKIFLVYGYNFVFVLIRIQFCLLVTYADGIKEFLQKISIGFIKLIFIWKFFSKSNPRISSFDFSGIDNWALRTVFIVKSLAPNMENVQRLSHILVYLYHLKKFSNTENICLYS